MDDLDIPKIEKDAFARLLNTEDPNSIIMTLCEEHNIHWGVAQEIVERVQINKKSQLTLVRSPILTLLALAFFIGGSVISTLSIAGLIFIYKVFDVSPESNDHPIRLVGFLIYLISYAPALFGYFILGLGMVIGSLKGMQAVWEAILQKANIN